MMTANAKPEASSADGAQSCSRCGARFRCGALAGDLACWCAALPVLGADRLRPDAHCLCPACLAAEVGRAARSD